MKVIRLQRGNFTLDWLHRETSDKVREWSKGGLSKEIPGKESISFGVKE